MEISRNPAIVRQKKELFFDEIDFDQQVPLPLEESDLTILQLFDRVLREVTSKGFSQSTLDLCMPYICRLAQLQAITNRQAFIMAICMNFSLNMSITLRAVANMLDTTNMMLMHWMPDFHALCEKELLEKMERRMGRMDEYVIPADVLEAFSNNEVFVKKTSKVENTLELLSTFYHLFKQKSKSCMETDAFIKKCSRLLGDNQHLPLVSKLKKLEFSSIESELILLHLCRFYVMNSMSNVSLGQIVALFDEGKDRNVMVYGLLQGNHELFQRKLITFGCADGIKDKETLCLTAKARHLLIPEYKLRGMNTPSSDMTSHKDIVFKNLYYNPSVEQQIQRLHSLLEEKNFRMVRKRLQERGFHKGIACLFYGSPGTGKTETVLQLAKSSGRDVMQVSMSQIRSKWVGESQKNIQEVFASYKERVRASKLCPILLFNEADAIIGNRMEVTTSSVDKMENSIQNVILQEMENLEGIMIATTNLQGSLDAAFERRFLYKVEFEKPSLQVRTQIWHSMMPDVDEATLSSIASQYDFSGGQIENIARKALVDDLLFYSSDISNKERISTFCRQEALS
ncbi:ATP-binding protein [Segatella copri]|uniref:ATP-binding protein n=1 Tax=Segatella copri TaxID=165179 RepID=UPI003F958A34